MKKYILVGLLPILTLFFVYVAYVCFQHTSTPKRVSVHEYHDHALFYKDFVKDGETIGDLVVKKEITTINNPTVEQIMQVMDVPKMVAVKWAQGSPESVHMDTEIILNTDPMFYVIICVLGALLILVSIGVAYSVIHPEQGKIINT